MASSSLSVISISIIICQWKRSLLAVSPPRDFILNRDAAIVDYRTPAVQRLRLAWPAWSRELVVRRAVGKSYLSSYFHRKVTLVLTGRRYLNNCPCQKTLNVCGAVVSLQAIRTREPSGFWNATFKICEFAVQSMRWAPFGTNLVRWPMDEYSMV